MYNIFYFCRIKSQVKSLLKSSFIIIAFCILINDVFNNYQFNKMLMTYDNDNINENNITFILCYRL